MSTGVRTNGIRHRFAPLGQDASSGEGMRLRGIIFDMDGTLCEPQNYMFGQMRSAVSIPKDEDILDYIHSLPDAEQKAAFEKIEAIEHEAMGKQVPQAGLVSLMEFLDRFKIPKSICTRNFDTPVQHLLTTHIPSHIDAFSPLITRSFRPPKPSPAGILHIAHQWGIVSSATVPASPSGERLLPLIMVGDSIDDMTAGFDAGAMTVLLRSEGKEDLEGHEKTDVVVDRLDDLIGMLEKGIA
ncbi:hypothetical protein LTR62_008101 [Meristemomyces frigidus]|uniref:HAD-like protein n=1 Tax=Meristemomyces frigidus TaxID=1508187 RepID=A0AAN7TE25_9PEZI|nr:hypothetical protein LTR62_008101 [Meristemomyces frigidus]